jgi:hypothetical protein
MSVYCECCVLSGRGVCDELITRPEESYQLLCGVVGSKNLINKDAIAYWELLHPPPPQKKYMYYVH